MKVKLPVLHSIAVGEGYKGSADDGSGMKKFLTELGVSIADDSGKSCLAADVDIDDGKSKVINIPKEEVKVETKSDNGIPSDIKQFIAASIEAESKRLSTVGVSSDRPKAPAVETGKSGHQRRWEDEKERGEAKAFKQYDTAKAYTHMVLAQMALGFNRPADYQKSMETYRQICEAKGYTTTSQAAGGALVPEQFETDIVNNVKDFGVARRICKTTRMTSDRVIRPKVTGFHTVYYPAEGSAATQSTQTWSNVTLTAKTGIVLVRMSLQILDDSAIDIVEHATREAARAIAKIEDDSLFASGGNYTGVFGQGTTAVNYIPSTLGWYNGVLGTDDLNDSRSTTGAGTAAAHTIAQVTTFMGTLPGYARARSAFHCTPEIMTTVLFRLAQAAGGVTFREFTDFGPVPMALGYPVITNSSMNNQSDASAAPYSGTAGAGLDILFGDMSLAAWFGDRGGTEVMVSDHRYMDSFEVGLRVSTRHDLVIADAGSTTAAGPIVAFWQS